MSLWEGINPEPSIKQPFSEPSVGRLFQTLADGDQKRDLALLLILAGAALLAIGCGFFQPGSLVERWPEFVRNVQRF
jgi:hypothetical protein